MRNEVVYDDENLNHSERYTRASSHLSILEVARQSSSHCSNVATQDSAERCHNYRISLRLSMVNSTAVEMNAAPGVYVGDHSGGARVSRAQERAHASRRGTFALAAIGAMGRSDAHAPELWSATKWLMGLRSEIVSSIRKADTYYVKLS